MLSASFYLLVIIYDHHMFIVQATGVSTGSRYVLRCLFVKSHITANNLATTEAREQTAQIWNTSNF
jgi:hypothetical protein